MITFNIRCDNEHVFEAWFNSGAAYDEQAASGKVACPICGDTKVNKAPMAPSVIGGKSRSSVDDTGGKVSMMRDALVELHRHVEANCEDVGEKFADEARKIHYGESEARDIHGKATDDEVRELKEEEIEFHQLPALPRTDS